MRIYQHPNPDFQETYVSIDRDQFIDEDESNLTEDDYEYGLSVNVDVRPGKDDGVTIWLTLQELKDLHAEMGNYIDRMEGR